MPARHCVSSAGAPPGSSLLAADLPRQPYCLRQPQIPSSSLKALFHLQSNFHLQTHLPSPTCYTPHTIQIFTMWSSSTYFSSGDASYSSSSSHSNTLLHGSNIKKHEDTLPNPKDILSQPEDAPLHFANDLPHPPSSPLLYEYT
jgi:hypothetical protein